MYNILEHVAHMPIIATRLHSLTKNSSLLKENPRHDTKGRGREKG